MRISLSAGSGDDLRSLHAWLVSEDALRGHAELRELPPGEDQLGPDVDAIVVAASPVVAVVGHVLVTWLKTRVGAVTINVRGKDGTQLELTSSNLANLDPESVARLAERIDALVQDESRSPSSVVPQAPLPPHAEHD